MGGAGVEPVKLLNTICLRLKVCNNFSMEFICFATDQSSDEDFSELSEALLVAHILDVQILQRNITIFFSIHLKNIWICS